MMCPRCSELMATSYVGCVGTAVHARTGLEQCEPVTFAPIDDVMRGLSSVVPHRFESDPNMGPQDAGRPMECRTCGLGYENEVHRS